MARPKTVKRLRCQILSLESELSLVKTKLDSREIELDELKDYYPDKIAELEGVIRDLLVKLGVAKTGEKEMSIEEFDSQDELDDAFDSFMEWESERLRLQKGIDELEQNVQKAEDEVFYADRDLLNAQIEPESCEAELSRCQERLDDAKAELAQLEQELGEHLTNKD